MATIDEAAQQLQVSKATIRRWIKSGEIEAYLEKQGPHGPQWQIPEGVLARRLHPDHTVIEVIPPDATHPMHLIRVITDSMITVEENLQRIDHQQQQLATGLTAMHHDLLAEITRLQEQITQLEAHLSKKSPSWWPWRR